MAVPLKQLLADSKRLVARDLFDPANGERYNALPLAKRC